MDAANEPPTKKPRFVVHGLKRKHDAVNVKQEEGATGAAEAARTQEEARRPALRAKRFMFLQFKNSFGTLTAWPVSEEALARVPAYAQQCKTVKNRAATTMSRPMVVDSHCRDTELMMHLVDYHSTGQIGPFALQGLTNLHPTRIVPFFALIRSLELHDMVDEVSTLLSKQDTDLSNFVAIATNCCADGAMVDVSAESILGRWIRSYFVENIQALDNGGWVDNITAKGGKLAKILMRVIMDHHAKRI